MTLGAVLAMMAIAALGYLEALLPMPGWEAIIARLLSSVVLAGAGMMGGRDALSLRPVAPDRALAVA